MRAVDRIRHLRPADWRLLVEAAWVLTRVRLALWTRPFEQVRRRFTTLVVARPPSPRGREGDPPSVAAAVRRARRFVPAATCLPQALATHYMLARRGVRSELRIGVAKDERGALQAHAWVEVHGNVVVGALPDLNRFERLPPLPGESS